jgi:hypothetical protein
MLLKACNRCGNLIPYGAAYCTTCKPIVQAEKEARIEAARKRNNRTYNAARDPKYSRFYNSPEWRMLSARRLQDDGYRCVWCHAIASEVDHIEEIKTPEGWERRLDYSNTRSMCHACHDKRHGRFVGKSNKRK